MYKTTKTLLKDLEKTQKEFWNIGPETGVFLNLFIKERKYKTALEIGTSNAYSSIWIAEALKQNNGKLHTIESNKKTRYPLALKNIKRSGLSKYINPILGHAPEDIPKTPKLFDIAFFDATKHEHLSYFETLKNRIKKGGCIITDNINSHKKDLEKYTKALKSQKNWKSYKIDIGTGLLVSIKG